MSHQNRRRSFSAESREPMSRGSRLGRIVLIGFVVALVATVAFISSAASADLQGVEGALFKDEALAADFALQVDPTEASVCAPNDPVYSVQVQSLNGFTDTVDLSLLGNPAGTNVNFNPLSDDAPYTSTLSIGITGATEAGSYVMEISGVSPTATHTTTVGLEVFDEAPGTITLTNPLDDAVDVSLTPLLVWESATQAMSYTVEVDGDSGFDSIDYTATVTTTQHTVAVSLAEGTEYYWRVRAINLCGSGSDSDAFSFTTLANPSIASTPASIDESMIVNAVVTNTLTITNTGTGNLEWDIEEAASGNCASPGGTLDWVSLSGTSGSEGAGLSSIVDVIFDAGGKVVGDYSGALCINSNDDSTPVVTVSLDMSVIDFDLHAEPVEQMICASEEAEYTVQVLSKNGFTEMVTLSVLGNPVGTTADFDPNPGAAPYTSTMTIADTAGASAGLYEMEIAGDWSTTTHTTTVSLDLHDVPDQVALTSPVDNAVNIPLKPLMDWEATAETTSYTLQIDDDNAFTSIDYTVTVIGTTEHTVIAYLQSDTEYFWRVRADNDCGDGSYSAVFSFTTRDVPPVLLVDDDEPSNNSRPSYTAALDSILGVGNHDVWDTNNSDNEPDAELLNFYNAVVWFTGSEWEEPAGPGDDGEDALATWLDGGGCLFISSQEYFYAKGLTPFMIDYLGVLTATSDAGQKDVFGVNTVYAGLGPYNMNYPFQDFADVIVPDATAEAAFLGTTLTLGIQPAAVDKQGLTYVTTFLGYPWEAIAAAGDREEVLETFLNWCDNEANPSIDSTPASFDEDMMANEVVINTLTITNTGSGNLIWDIGEAESGSCASTGAIDWVSLSETSGFTGAGLSSEIEVVFEPDGIAEGDYSGALSLITVPLDMSVEWYYVYIPYLEK